MTQKSPDAFRTISEVARSLDLPQHVLRFWETRFTQIKPLKRGGGRRYYRPDDIDLLRGIQFLLYEKGYTIRGAQRVLRDRGIGFVARCWRDVEGDGEAPVLSSRVPHQSVGTAKRNGDSDAGEPANPDGKRASAVSATPALGASEPLSASDIETLNEALVKLLECKRLLDRARA